MKRYNILMVMKTFFVLLVLALAVVLYGQPAQAIVIGVQNGSFENGAFVPTGTDYMNLTPLSTAITNWTVITQPVNWIVSPNPYGISASNGYYFLDLTGNNTAPPFGGVEQIIHLYPGAYTLQFDLGSDFGYGIPSAIKATAGSTSATFTSTSSSYNAWTLETMRFTVTGIEEPQSVTISLTGTTATGNAGLNYIGLDNVSVTAVPLPPAVLLLGSGLMGLGLLRRKWGLKA